MNMIGNADNDTGFRNMLLLNERKVSNIRKAFGNNFAINVTY